MKHRAWLLIGVIALGCSGGGGKESPPCMGVGCPQLGDGDGGASSTHTDGGLQTGDGAVDPNCVPDCAALSCGLDPVCGKSCGECGVDGECEAGQCVKHCDLDPLASDTKLDLDIVRHEVKGVITRNGMQWPDSQSVPENRGSLRFVPVGFPQHAIGAQIGPSGPAAYSALVPVGVYDVVLFGSGYGAPGQHVLARSLVIDGPRTLDYDFESVRVEIGLTLNGAPLPDEMYQRGAITLVNTEDGFARRVDLQPTGPVSGILEVFVGDYDIWYEGPSDGAYMPQGARKLAAAWTATTAPQTFDVESVRLTGSVTFQGAMFEDNPDGVPSGRAAIELRDLETGRILAFNLGPTGPATFGATVIKGKYAVVLRDGQQFFMPETGALLEVSLDLAADMSRTWDVHPITISGAVTLDGLVSDTTFGNAGQILFRSKATGYTVGMSLEDDDMGHAVYSVELLPGRYDVIARRFTLPNMLRLGDITVLSDVELNATGTQDIAIETIDLVSTLTEGGTDLSATTMAFDRGAYTVLDLGRPPGYNVSTLGNMGPARFHMALPKGRFAVELSGTGAPPAVGTSPPARHLLEVGTELTSDGMRSYDIRFITVSGTVTVNGAPLPETMDTNAGRGRIEAVNLLTGSVAFVELPLTGPATYSLSLLAGPYDLRYRSPSVPGVLENFPIRRGCLGTSLGAPANCAFATDDLSGKWFGHAESELFDFEAEVVQSGDEVSITFQNTIDMRRYELHGKREGNLVTLAVGNLGCPHAFVLHVVSGCVARAEYYSYCSAAGSFTTTRPVIVSFYR